MTWLEEFRCDGLRFDSTVYIRTVDGDPRDPADGPARRLVVPGLAQRRDPGAPAVEDHDRRGPRGRSDPGHADRRRGRRVRRPVGRRLHPPRPAEPRGRATTPPATWTRSSTAIARRRAAATRRAGSSTPSRTTRWPTAWSACPRRSRPATPATGGRRSAPCSASALVLTSPGIPMLFQGQELLEDRWFDDTVALDWDEGRARTAGILRLHRDLIALRRARDGTTRRPARLRTSRSCAPTRRPRCWPCTAGMDGGPHDDTVVVANFADRTIDDLADRVPGTRSLERALQLRRGRLRRASSAATRRSTWTPTVTPLDGCEQSGLVSVGPYSVVILSRED